MNIFKSLFLLFILSTAFWSCSNKTKIEDVSPNIADTTGTSFPKVYYNYTYNKITDDGILLGKKLFYDGTLSRDGSISCAECHNQAYAFTHHGHALSHGIDDQVGTRNAPPLFNLAYHNSFFWDGGVKDLDFFHVAPITNPVEMDQDLGVLISKLQHNATYVNLFKKAYGSEEITTDKFLKAISQFVLSLESKNSKYDQYKAGKVSFSQSEKEGLALFETKGCSTCHKPPLFTDLSFRSNGLDTTYFRNYVDHGHARVTEQTTDQYKFKVPSLRNITVTYPYMHDGRYATLEDVLDHYDHKIVQNKNLDPIFTKKNPAGISINADEKTKIISFLKTLQDDEFLKNPKYAAP